MNKFNHPSDALDAIRKIGDLPPMPTSKFMALEAAAKTAVKRKDASVPLRHFLGVQGALALSQAGLTWLDYGCGHGADVHYLRERGIDAVGWDPYWSEIFPPHPDDTPERRAVKLRHSELRRSDIVTMTYVLNVIASTADRAAAIHDALDHVVPGGMVMIAARSKSDVDSAARRGGWNFAPQGGYYVGGTVSRRYQRGYTHGELQQEVRSCMIPSHWEDLGPVPGSGFVGRVWRRKP